ncbi:hypothetical protein [Alteromonas sp. OM2203]|uniref:hypothetical protein n=1 Tax=Alteromonas sp. OM2203 TaxID=3398817 RepID=UPI003AF37D2A
MDQHSSKSEVTLEELEAELVTVIDDPELRDEWVNSPIPILELRTPKSFFNTAEDRARLMQVLLEMKFGEMA